ncbi:RUN domain-containing protein 1 [Schistosoma japonicum]|nr:RUN domain-containing protein 1 [Schistosoma japonicum]
MNQNSRGLGSTNMSVSQPVNQISEHVACEEKTFSFIEESGCPKERWAPLGANASPERDHYTLDDNNTINGFDSELSRLALENEHLNNLLMAFTSHIAQVQFRLGQVLNAESDSRELMLKSLEEFASSGIPDLQSLAEQCNKFSESQAYTSNLNGRPQKMIEQLRRHLDDLERFAYETGEQSEPPTQAILEKQRLVLEGLQEKLELNISNVDKLSAAELQQVVDKAVNQFLNPVKVNEKLVEQLKTQVNDLERFIDFLHGSGACSDALAKALSDFKRTHQQLSANDEIPPCCNYSNRSHTQNDDHCNNLDGNNIYPSSHTHPGVQLGHSRHLHSDGHCVYTSDYNDADSFDAYIEDMTSEQHDLINGKNKKSNVKKSRVTIVNLIQRAITVLNIFAASQLGQDPDKLLTKLKVNKYSTYKVDKANSATVEKAKAQHWGTIRARLEVAINMVQEKVTALNSYKQHKAPSINLYSTYHTIPNITRSCTTHVEAHHAMPSGRESPDGKASMPSHNNVVRSYAPLRKSFSQDEVPGTQIALPVQNLHDASLRAMLYGGRPDRMFSNPTLYDDKDKFSSYTENIGGYSEGGLCGTTEFLYSEAERTIMNVVRRYFCPALRDLIEHGLIKKALPRIDENSPSGLINKRSIFLFRPILNCLDSKSRNHSEDKFECYDLNEPLINDINKEYSSVSHSSYLGIHAWDVLMRFYQIKNGPRYNESPARKLCESFDLDAVDGKSITNRQKFFNAIGTVLQGHVAYKRSNDAKFKAFISIALNEGKLVSWLRMIFRNHAFVQSIYEPWSYTLSTGFNDALQSLNKLKDLEFSLPYDYSIRHLKEIRDAF